MKNTKFKMLFGFSINPFKIVRVHFMLKRTILSVTILCLLTFASLVVVSCQQEKISPDDDASDFGFSTNTPIAYSFRNIVGRSCIEKTIGYSDWQPFIKANFPVVRTFNLVTEMNNIIAVELQGSVGAAAEAQLLSFIKANVSITATAKQQADLKNTMQSITSATFTIPAGQQLRLGIKTMYENFSAEFYNPSSKKWQPITFDKYIGAYLVHEWNR